MKSLVDRNIKNLLEEGRKADLSEMLLDLHPADIAEIMSSIDMDSAITVMSLLDTQKAADVLVELSDSFRDQLASVMPIDDLTKLVAEMDSDDAADIVAELSEDEAHHVLSAIEPEDSEDVRKLLMYDAESAGGLMQVELVAAYEDNTVSEVIEKIRQASHVVDDINYVFVEDKSRMLRGQVGLKDLLLALDKNSLVKDLMDYPVLVVKVDEDQEVVAQKFQKYDVKAAPVVDSQNRLLGRITVDDIIDVMHEEADKDFYRLVGSSEEEVYSSGSIKIASLRVPWLIFNLLGGFVTSYILSVFEASLADLLVLLTFVPMVLSLSGAVGSQSATITVRGLAVGRILQGKWWNSVFKEMRVSTIIALALGILIAVITGAIHTAPQLGMAVGLSIMAAILVSTFLGSIIPLFFRAISVDPAMASGPVVTSVNDVVSLIIYLLTSLFIMTQ